MNLTEKVLMNLADRERQEARRRFEPTQEQELLLRAGLREGKEALDAWCQWHKTVDIDRLDFNSQRLLPLSYHNLRTHLRTQDAKVPSLGRLKGTYRYTWCKNQIVLQSAATCLRAFHEAGIETLVLKGAALISCYYKDVGSRFMNDFDILVRAEQAPEAVRVLRDAGWQPKFTGGWQPKLPPERLFLTRHSIAFADTAQRECDLHVRVLEECIQPGGDAYFWDAAVPANIGGVTTRVLSPADQLLHVCVHGIRRVEVNTAPPVDWIADAVMIATAATTSRDGMDWHRLITLTRKLCLTLPLRDTLCYLQDRWDVEIPPAVLHSLQKTPVSHVKHIEHVARTGPPTVLNRARYFWTQNARLVGDAGSGHQLVRFPAYLRNFYGLKHSWQILLRMAYALVHRLGLRGREN